MAYHVKELFYTLQGEGAQAGRAAVVLRFAGCNLWSGLERDRATAACTFCDTDFVGTDGPGGGRFEQAASLAQQVRDCWDAGQAQHSPPKRPEGRQDPAARPRAGQSAYVVCTGGEPLLQLDDVLVDALHALDLQVAVETNGTQSAPAGLDWVCVSPKGRNPLALTVGNELKLVYPQQDAPPEAFVDLAFEHFILQPMDGPQQRANMAQAVAYCLAHPQWRLGLQTHKWLGIP